MRSHLRGHPIELREDDTWVFCDTGESTVETWTDRPCGHCGEHDTEEGHDGCLGTLPRVVNACCGHGFPCEAYVVLENDQSFRGAAALRLMEELRRG